MPTDVSRAQSIAVFLFAHQDDEFGVYRQILISQMRGMRVICVYLTSGVPCGGDPGRRNAESLAVLGRLGVSEDDVVFAGGLLEIADGTLVDSMEKASEWLASWLASLSSVAAVYVPAWEGGHPDHDALHAVAVLMCSELAIGASLWQFPLYNAYRCPGKFFRVLFPLSKNGEVVRSVIPLGQRFGFLRLALSYPSQRISWIGLFPFFLLHYMLKGTQELQRVRLERVCERPHDGALYYEKRGFSSWLLLSSRVRAWLAVRPEGSPVRLLLRIPSN